MHPNIKISKNFFEKAAWTDNLYACGLDEVGRGCLAGPLVTGAVILPPKTSYRLLKDSKILTEAERNTAYAWITKHCFWSVGIVSPQTIDTINIYQATLYAMKKAYLQLIEQMPISLESLKFVLIDAMPLTLPATARHAALELHHFNYGERFSASIAAASIVAKVTRDRLMEKIATSFPAFGFEQHKGYATKQHIDALLEHGATLIHRQSFISKIKTNPQKLMQQNLFELETHEET